MSDEESKDKERKDPFEKITNLHARVIGYRNEGGGKVGESRGEESGHGPGGEMHTVYVISVRWGTKEWQIAHRFRDFDALRQHLLQGHLVKLPSLPAKTWFGRNLDPDFIKKRCEELDHFVQRLVVNPTALQNKQFIQFLSLEKNIVSGAEMNKELTVDDFDLLKVLGQGSFGKVLQVMKKDTRKIYAMKVLKKQELVRRNQIAHTKTERKVLAEIEHPFIVSLRYAFQTKEKLYMVLDFFTGGELFFHLKREGRFSEDRARYYMAEVLLAFEHLHENKVVYRDLKPENILLDSEGHIRLTDFGLSKDFDASGPTLTRTFCGTPEYLAPEVIARKEYGTMIDWWSFGTLLFELLTGAPPFMHSNQKIMYERILHADIPFPSYFSNNAKSFINALLRRDPQKRLGANGGASEVQKHPFFEGMDWKALLNKQIPPPFKPQVQSEEDVSYVDDEFKLQRPVDTPVGSAALGVLAFPEFTYIPPSDRGISEDENEEDGGGGSVGDERGGGVKGGGSGSNGSSRKGNKAGGGGVGGTDQTKDLEEQLKHSLSTSTFLKG